MDIVVPTYRTNNHRILDAICRLSSGRRGIYVRIWLVVDNPDKCNLAEVKELAKKINEERFGIEGNYFVTVLYYADNRGPSYARNLGFNYSMADWVLFLDAPVITCWMLMSVPSGVIRMPKYSLETQNFQSPSTHGPKCSELAT